MVIQQVVNRICVIFLLAIPCVANAEILHRVFPLDSLKTIKETYPYGQFTRVNAAWVTENEAFYSMTGQGFPGTLYLAFTDDRPGYRKTLAEKCAGDSPSMSEGLCNLYRNFSTQTDEISYKIQWVRWVPAQPIPFERYRSKYGEPTKFEFDADTMTPTVYWESVELRASLSDDKKYVMKVDAQFSRSELRAAWLRIGNFVPDYLKEPDITPLPLREKKKIPSRAM